MEHYEILRSLRDDTERWLENWGWNIFFEIIEETEGNYFLKVRTHLINDVINSYNITDTTQLKFKLDLIDIYEKGLEITKAKKFYIDNPPLRKNEYGVFDHPGFYSFVFGLNYTLGLNSLFVSIYFDTIKRTFLYQVSIKNFYSIKDIYLNFIDRNKEIYFLGENGDGKSLILMGIYLAFNKRFVQSRTQKKDTGKVIDMIEENKDLKLVGIDTNELNYGDDFYYRNFFSYGVHRGRYSTDIAEQYGFMSLFDCNLELNNPVSWLKQLYLVELEKKLDEKKISNDEIPAPNNIPLVQIQELLSELLEKNVTIEVKSEGVKFKEKGFELTFEQLSEGYKNVMIWVCDLVFRLLTNQPIEKLNELTGVVMVDEIELHLHPKWQRNLVGKLRKFFPNIQFIFTTHSPTIIQGASDEAIIYKVYRDKETGHTHVSEPYYKKDLDNLMLNSLVTSPLFGLDNARMTNNPVTPDTSDTFALSRINKRVEARLAEQKKNGKVMFTDVEIDALIDLILNEEMSGHEKNK